MLNFFRKEKKRTVERHKLQVTQLNAISYPPKIIIAWAKAIEGDKNLLHWLKENGYFELCMATYAIYLKDEARLWLSKNGYAHLLAFINAAEGVKSAQKWLKTHHFELLFYMAMTIEHEEKSLEWLQKNATNDIIILTQTIRKIKDKIEENHNDIHTFRKDL